MESLVLKSKQEDRIIGIDLIKIFSMIMMVALHIIGNFGIMGHIDSIPYKICAVVYFPTRCAVNCYAIASGFLLVNKKSKVSRILYLWIQTFVYSFFIAVLFKIFAPETVSLRKLFEFALPVISLKYWYISAYFLLFFFIPVLNTGIRNLSKKGFTIVLFSILFITLFSSLLCRTVFDYDPFVIGKGLSPIWLIIMYLVGAYIKLYYFEKKISLKVLIPLFLLVNVINLAIYFIFAPRDLNYSFIYYYDFPTVFIASVCLVLIFIRIKKVNSGLLHKIIVSLSTATLGVYLIHVHPLIYNNLLVKLNFIIRESGFTFIMLLFVAIIGVYLICSLIDIVRKYLFKLIKIDLFCQKTDKFLEKNDAH